MIKSSRFASLTMLCALLFFSCSSDSETQAQTYAYCVYSVDKFCANGPFATCQGNGVLSNSCPYSSSSSPSGVSSSSKPSSSSSVFSSSSVPTQTGIIHGTPVDYEGETYETVVIGNQTWMARNLNYDASGSECYDSRTDNCRKYGHLYDWVTAMALPSSCRNNTCPDQIQSKHRGICPSGWHIPSSADWSVLMKFINPSCPNNGSCTGAGTKLKATSGWNTGIGYEPGQDTYGFSALPGGYNAGYSSPGSNGYNGGNDGYWWSAWDGGSSSLSWSMGYNHDYARRENLSKGYLYSVRCLKD